MPFRYRKTIKIRDGVRLNVSQSSISLSLGKKGASVNIAPKSTNLNLSLPGSGLSYRTKIGEGYEKKLEELEKALAHKEKKKTGDRLIAQETHPDRTVSSLDPKEDVINIHRSAPEVKTEEVFRQAWYDAFEIRKKILWKRLLDGNPESIEQGIETTLNALVSDRNISVSYELDDHTLYADLDLFEIEEWNEYETQNDKQGQPVLIRKDDKEINREYAQNTVSLGIYLAASFFNVSPYITEIVLSAYTQRKTEEEVKDTYLYSVRYLRPVFEKTIWKDVKDPFAFFLQFDHRIEMNSDYSLDPVEPFEKTVIPENDKTAQ